jgi:hypothetical protein
MVSVPVSWVIGDHSLRHISLDAHSTVSSLRSAIGLSDPSSVALLFKGRILGDSTPLSEIKFSETAHIQIFEKEKGRLTNEVPDSVPSGKSSDTTAFAAAGMPDVTGPRRGISPATIMEDGFKRALPGFGGMGGADFGGGQRVREQRQSTRDRIPKEFRAAYDELNEVEREGFERLLVGDREPGYVLQVYKALDCNVESTEANL